MTSNIDTMTRQERTLPFTPNHQSTRTLGAFSLSSSGAKMISNNRAGEFAFYYAPGWHTDGAVIASNFDRHVEHLGSSHYGVHPEGEYSIDLQKEAWMDARKKDGLRPAKIYAPSKGALTVSHMFSDPTFRKDFGEVDSICFDSPVSSKYVLNRIPNYIMRVGMKLPDHPAIERLSRVVMKTMLTDEPDFDESLVTKTEALENSAASTRTRLVACLSQLRYIWTHDVADFDLCDFGASVSNKTIISATNDSIIDIGKSANAINESYGGGFVHWIDTTRKPGEHATGTERPRGVIDALTKPVFP
ncbi:MAG: hypothetical protein WAW80_00050 [Candidatus Saccharimonadales bacterium]